MAVRRWYQGADDQPTIEEEIEALEAGGGREATSPERYRAAVRDPLGVEPNYRVVKTAPGEPLSARTRSQVLSGFPELKETLDAGPVPRVWAQKPRYFRDDEWKPASWGSEAIIALQRALAVAGYLDLDSMPPLGRWDPTSRNAYADLLAEANAAGLTAEEQLAQSAQAVRMGGRGTWQTDPETGELRFVPEEFVAPPLTLQTTDRDTLRSVFRSATTQMGLSWNMDQIEEVIDAYVAKQTQLQTDAYNQEVARLRSEFEGAPSSEPITSVTVPSPANFFEEEARRTDPTGVAAGEIGEVFAPAFFEALGGYV